MLLYFQCISTTNHPSWTRLYQTGMVHKSSLSSMDQISINTQNPPDLGIDNALNNANSGNGNRIAVHLFISNLKQIYSFSKSLPTFPSESNFHPYQLHNHLSTKQHLGSYKNKQAATSIDPRIKVHRSRRILKLTSVAMWHDITCSQWQGSC